MSFGLHINQGRHRDTGATIYTFVGSVPENLLDWRKPTTSDVMGGRVNHATGLAHYTRIYYSVAQIIGDAERDGAKLCQSPKCACRRLFPENFYLLIDEEFETTLYEFLADNTSKGVDITTDELETVMSLKPGQGICIGMCHCVIRSVRRQVLTALRSKEHSTSLRSGPIKSEPADQRDPETKVFSAMQGGT